MQARRLILANGYSSQFTEEFFVKHQLHTTADCALISQREPLTYLVEVHWTLLQDSAKDLGGRGRIMGQARPADFFGVRAWHLTPEWQFLYLSFHAAYHKWNTLKWLADIHELCISTPMDWQTGEGKRRDVTNWKPSPNPRWQRARCSSARRFRRNLVHRSFPADVRLFP